MEQQTTAIDKPRASLARKQARSLLERSGVISTPILINQVLGTVRLDYPGVRIHETSRLPSKVYALTSRDGDEIDIAYNSRVSINKQKFSFAHELGHLYLSHMHSGPSCDFENHLIPEKEANIFASELIMPRSLLEKAIESLEGNPGQLIKNLGVSEEAFWWRILGLGWFDKLSQGNVG